MWPLQCQQLGSAGQESYTRLTGMASERFDGVPLRLISCSYQKWVWLTQKTPAVTSENGQGWGHDLWCHGWASCWTTIKDECQQVNGNAITLVTRGQRSSSGPRKIHYLNCTELFHLRLWLIMEILLFSDRRVRMALGKLISCTLSHAVSTRRGRAAIQEPGFRVRK